MTTRADLIEKIRARQALLSQEGTTQELEQQASAPVIGQPGPMLSVPAQDSPSQEVAPDRNNLMARVREAQAEIEGPSIFDTVQSLADDAADTIAGVLPERIDPDLARFTGGLAGGTLGAAAGPITSLAGAALLAEGMGQAAELFNEFVLNNTDEQKAPAERALDAASNIAVDMSLGGIGSRVGEGLRAASKNVFGTATNRTAQVSPRQLLDDFRQARVQPTAGAVGSQLVQGSEQALSKMPTSAKIVQRHLSKTIDDVNRFSGDVAGQIARSPGTVEPQVAGRRVQKALQGFVASGIEKQAQLYDRVSEFIPDKFRVPMANTRELIGQNQNLVQELRSSRDMIVPKEFTRILGDIEEAGGRLSWSAVKNFRSAVGEMIGDPQINRSASKQKLSRLYASLTADMKLGAEAAGPGARAAWERANDFTRGFELRKELIADIADSRLGREAFDAALAGSKKGPELLNAVKKSVESVDPQAWRDFVGTYFYEFSRALPGQQAGQEASEFSINTFLKNYNTLKKSGTADVLFAGKGMKESKEALERLVRISQSLKDTQQFANPSGTAQQTVFMNILQGNLGQAATQAGIGTAAGAATVGSLGLMTPAIYGKLVTSPRFVNWLGQGLEIAPTNFNGIGTHLGRLAAITKAEPELREPINELLKNIHFARDQSFTQEQVQ